MAVGEHADEKVSFISFHLVNLGLKEHTVKNKSQLGLYLDSSLIKNLSGILQLVCGYRVGSNLWLPINKEFSVMDNKIQFYCIITFALFTNTYII